MTSCMKPKQPEVKLKHIYKTSFVGSFVIIVLLWCARFSPLDVGAEAKNGCSIFKHLGANDLSINDIVVKSSLTNVACIKARFSLAMKVEAVIEDDKLEDLNNNKTAPGSSNSETSRIVLGYLPLDSVVSVEDSCPKPPGGDGQSVDKKLNSASTQATPTQAPENKELEMVVYFECGRFVFHFKRDDSFYVSAIRGIVNLDSNTNRSFIAEKPMFFTSDLTHHFKFNELIEVDSVVQNKAYILTANFYNSEFEVFRNTSSRDFIRPPDDKSKPFLQ